MHVRFLQSLNQCGIEDADALALTAGGIDGDGASTARQGCEIRMIDEVGFTTDSVNRERLEGLCVKDILECVSVHERSVGETFPPCKRSGGSNG